MVSGPEHHVGRCHWRREHRIRQRDSHKEAQASGVTWWWRLVSTADLWSLGEAVFMGGWAAEADDHFVAEGASMRIRALLHLDGW